MKVKRNMLVSAVTADEVEKELAKFLDKKGYDVKANEWDDTVEYIRSLFDDEWINFTTKEGIKDLKGAVSAWFNDTLKNYPETLIKQSAKRAIESSAEKDVDDFADELEDDLYWGAQDILRKYQDKLGIESGGTYLDMDEEIRDLSNKCIAILKDQLALNGPADD